MKRAIWIILAFILSTIVALLGTMIASYLQECFKLADAGCFIFVAAVFVICLALMLFVTQRSYG